MFAVNAGVEFLELQNMSFSEEWKVAAKALGSGPHNELLNDNRVLSRWLQTAVVANNNIYLFGDLHLYDVSTNTWHQMRPAGRPPKPRCQAALFPILTEKYVLLFGGASHNSGRDFTTQVYGDVVEDLCDIMILDLETNTWLQCFGGGCQLLRGGVNALVQVPSPSQSLSVAAEAEIDSQTKEMNTFLLLGGMHSDPGHSEPTFKGDVVSLSLRLLCPRGGADICIRPYMQRT
ncbi:hypothetical protein CYMTET_46333 [Cymbomonas tetramitiformis]|uniref:Uncharacterized protein n=1 Tax=Cymbomonas tetramitiformis TaxID=36881 RepID=A0AAE0EXP9_9CHLO|nr:hypothetical protein CYMTET_46333 [Cymbomonas tetramitiformis]